MRLVQKINESRHGKIFLIFPAMLFDEFFVIHYQKGTLSSLISISGIRKVARNQVW